MRGRRFKSGVGLAVPIGLCVNAICLLVLVLCHPANHLISAAICAVMFVTVVVMAAAGFSTRTGSSDRSASAGTHATKAERSDDDRPAQS